MTGIHPMVLMKVHSFRLHKFLSCQSLPSPQASYFSLEREEWGAVAKESGEQAKKSYTEEKNHLEQKSTIHCCRGPWRGGVSIHQEQRE